MDFYSINNNQAINRIKKNSSLKCAVCRGLKMFCGKSKCPVLMKYFSTKKIKPLINKTVITGSSPPSVFIGRLGYPKVSIGPLIPPIVGDTSIIDSPEKWLEKDIDEIVDFRSMLIRGKYTTSVYDLENTNKIIESTRELALAKNCVYSEAFFFKKPNTKISFYDEIQPHGPSAKIKKIEIENPKFDERIEKAFYDTDLNSKEAILYLYKNGVTISKIQRAFSVGAFGLKKLRRFVPTRWTITAVDSIIGETLKTQTKKYPWIENHKIYYLNQFDNRWLILMIPSEWQYELIEAWYPNTTWNPFGKNIAMYNSYEFYSGRSTYAEIGGCYYAARFASNELLNKERRQASVLILRESHPGYIMPLGVWNVRESVRKALNGQPYKFDNLNESLLFIKEKMDIPLRRWIKNSAILKCQLFQKRIENFLEK
jgi:hypothetical protein